MSTRSIIAIPQGDSWKGRYCHSDGYPTWNGRTLWALVQRDGLDTVRRVLTEDHYGWSSIDGEGTGGLAAGHADGRFVKVPGFGTAYTTKQGQSSADDWLTPTQTNDTEWFYVLADDGMWIGERTWDESKPAVPFTMARWNGPEPVWADVESHGEVEG